MRVTHAGVDAAWLEDQLTELERLVEHGDAPEIVSHLATIVRGPQRPGAHVDSPVER